jgi:hypothetical protein
MGFLRLGYLKLKSSTETSDIYEIEREINSENKEIILQII